MSGPPREPKAAADRGPSEEARGDRADPKPPRGTRDLLPPGSERLEAFQRGAARIAAAAGYRLVITPEFEATEIFSRGIGEATDIVSKEMYTFADRSGNSLTLRPEGTAPVMRAVVTHRLYDAGLPVKLYYAAPMFRYERPQKGRYRQHFQFGIEAVGSDDPALDAEVIRLGHDILRASGAGDISLLVNSMGHPGPECRGRYLPALREFLAANREALDGDCKRRMETNPMRVFDCKAPADVEILAGAPALDQFLCEGCRTHFGSVLAHLDRAEETWTLSTRLVRGFDYYTRTVFEYQSGALEAAQNALGGGGRYDGLVAELGGPELPGIGFALGADRVLIAQEAAGHTGSGFVLDCYVIPLAPDLRDAAVDLVWSIRSARSGEPLAADMPYVARGLKGNLKQADKSGARFAALIGPAEALQGSCTMRDMATGDQQMVKLTEVPSWLAERSR